MLYQGTVEFFKIKDGLQVKMFGNHFFRT